MHGLLQSFSAPRTLEKKMSEDPFADHDFEIDLNMDFSTTSNSWALVVFPLCYETSLI